MNRNASTIDDEFGPIPFNTAAQSARDLCPQEEKNGMSIFSINIDFRE